MREGTSTPMRRFPPAPHPEIMRADQKDSQYVNQLCDACHDAYSCIFGQLRATAYQNETKLVGQALYFFLTTGLGVQTLGEEYSNISQVVGLSSLPLNPARRTLLVFLQTAVPYLAERVRRKISQASQQSIVLQLSDADVPSAEVSDSSVIPAWHFLSVKQRLQRLWLQVLQHWPAVLPSVKEGLVLLSRANLMLFYFKGVYYDVAKRVAGVQYALLMKPPQQKTRYHMLGVFLLIQLCITGSNWFRQNVVSLLANSLQPHSEDRIFLHSGRQGVQILDEDKNAISNAYWLSKSDSASASIISPESMRVEVKCTLCLGPMKWPTATPCGHVFCWDCVAECCNQKPECPLCRSHMTHCDLVPIYNAHF
ncbi:hypothetical protein GOP47_0027171 [Adiantum capillus-veneris]|nr:hypothetical protein GOP47_0027171 [Adiantum capillus-veneris]